MERRRNSISTTIKKSTSYLTDIQIDKNQIDEAQNNIGGIQNKINLLNEKLSDFPDTQEIDIYNDEIEETGDAILEIAGKKGEEEYKLKKSEEGGIDIQQLEFQEKFINLIENKVGEHKREVLEQRLNEVKSIVKEKWSEIWKKDIWSIDFDNNFIPTLRFKGNEQTLRGLSGSEKIMLSVIIRAALLEKVMDVKTLILDDPSILLSFLISFCNFF